MDPMGQVDPLARKKAFPFLVSWTKSVLTHMEMMISAKPQATKNSVSRNPVLRTDLRFLDVMFSWIANNIVLNV